MRFVASCCGIYNLWLFRWATATVRSRRAIARFARPSRSGSLCESSRWPVRAWARSGMSVCVTNRSMSARSFSPSGCEPARIQPVNAAFQAPSRSPVPRAAITSQYAAGRDRGSRSSSRRTADSMAAYASLRAPPECDSATRDNVVAHHSNSLSNSAAGAFHARSAARSRTSPRPGPADCRETARCQGRIATRSFPAARGCEGSKTRALFARAQGPVRHCSAGTSRGARARQSALPRVLPRVWLSRPWRPQSTRRIAPALYNARARSRSLCASTSAGHRNRRRGDDHTVQSTHLSCCRHR